MTTAARPWLLAAMIAVGGLILWLCFGGAEEPPAPPRASPPEPESLALTTRPVAGESRIAGRPKPPAEARGETIEVRGRVTDRSTSTAVSGAIVAVCDPDLGAAVRRGTTSQDGTFVFVLSDVDPPRRLDDLVLVVRQSPFRRYVESVPQVSRAPDGRLDVRLEPAPGVSGSVKLIDGAPVVGAKLTLERQSWKQAPEHRFVELLAYVEEPRGYNEETNATGAFAFSNLYPGRYILRATARGLLRQTARNEVLDMTTQVVVPPSKTGIHLVFEPCWYVACRPVDSKTGEPIRAARQTVKSAHVQDATSKGTSLAEIAGPDRIEAFERDAVYLGLLNESRRSQPIQVGFEAPGYRDQLATPSPRALPHPDQWPTELQIIDVPMESEPLRRPVDVAVAFTGPAWTRECRALDVFVVQRPSEMNPTPTVPWFERRVVLTEGQGTMSLLPGKYQVQSGAGHRRFKPVLQFDVRPESTAPLQLIAEEDRTPLRITGVSPAGVTMPLMFVVIREDGKPDTAPELMRASPEADDPNVILALVPQNRPLKLALVPAGGPCGSGTMTLPSLPGTASFQDVRIRLDWAFP